MDGQPFENIGGNASGGPPSALGPVAPREMAPHVSGDDLLLESFASDPSNPGDGHKAFAVGQLLRYKWMALFIFVIVAGASIPAIWTLVPAQYLSLASIRVRPNTPQMIFDVPEKNGAVPYYYQFLNTQVAIVRGTAVLSAVLEREDVQATEWYNEEPKSIRTMLGGDPPSQLERIKDVVEASPRRQTEFIDVAATTVSGADSKTLVDAVVEEYVQYTEAHAEEDAELVYKTLSEESKTLAKDMGTLVEQIGNLSKKIGTDDPDIVRSQVAKRLAQLETERETLQRKFTIASEELAALESSKVAAQTHETKTDVAVYRYAGDEEWRRLNLALKNERNKLVMAGQQYGSSHPKIRELTGQVGHMESLLMQRQAELDAGIAIATSPKPTMRGGESEVPHTLTELKRLVPRQERELELLDAQLASLREEQLEKGEYAKTVAGLQQELRQKKDLSNRVEERLKGLEFEGKAPGRISVGSFGIEPKTPNKDRRPLLSVMAFLGAMMCGVVAAYLRVATDSRIREASDLDETSRVPFLGQLPPLPRRCNLYGELPSVLTQHVRMVRTALLERLGKRANRCVLITSSTMQTGKSVLSILLAQSLAKLGRKVLLVEADMYRPSLSQHLNMKPLFGLPTLLQGAVTDKEAILPTGLKGFDILLVGDPPTDFNHDILANGDFAACIERWKKTYDIVLLDGPPVLPVADARILASQADGTLMVLRSSHSRRADVVQTYADLSAAGGKLLGTVLVDAPTGTSYSSYATYETAPSVRQKQYRLENTV